MTIFTGTTRHFAHRRQWNVGTITNTLKPLFRHDFRLFTFLRGWTIGLRIPDAIKHFSADCQPFAKYIELMPGMTRSFAALELRHHDLAIDFKGVANIISFDWATSIVFKHNYRLPKSKDNTLPARNLYEDRWDELVVHKSLGHSQIKDDLNYQVRYYDNEARNDTFETPSSIPHHFISRDWSLHEWRPSSIVGTIPVIPLANL